MAYYRCAFTGPLVIHRIGHLRYGAVFLPPELEEAVGVRVAPTARPAPAAPTAAAAAAPRAGRTGRVRMTGEIADLPIDAAWQPAGPAAGGGYDLTPVGVRVVLGRG
jgi:hypothetical protein